MNGGKVYNNLSNKLSNDLIKIIQNYNKKVYTLEVLSNKMEYCKELKINNQNKYLNSNKLIIIEFNGKYWNYSYL